MSHTPVRAAKADATLIELCMQMQRHEAEFNRAADPNTLTIFKTERELTDLIAAVKRTAGDSIAPAFEQQCVRDCEDAPAYPEFRQWFIVDKARAIETGAQALIARLRAAAAHTPSPSPSLNGKAMPVSGTPPLLSPIHVQPLHVQPLSQPLSQPALSALPMPSALSSRTPLEAFAPSKKAAVQTGSPALSSPLPSPSVSVSASGNPLHIAKVIVVHKNIGDIKAADFGAKNMVRATIDTKLSAEAAFRNALETAQTSGADVAVIDPYTLPGQSSLPMASLAGVLQKVLASGAGSKLRVIIAIPALKIEKARNAFGTGIEGAVVVNKNGAVVAKAELQASTSSASATPSALGRQRVGKDLVSA